MSDSVPTLEDLEAALGSLDGDDLSDPSTHRQPDQVGLLLADRVEQSRRVAEQVLAAVRRLPGRRCRRTPGVAVVVAGLLYPYDAADARASGVA